MKKQKDPRENEKGQKIDGRRFSNRNPQKWFLEHDEALRQAIDREETEALSQGKYISQRQILRKLAKNRAFLKKIPAVGGGHRLTESSEKTYARLAKRAQHPNVILPPVAKALGLGQRKVNVVMLCAEIEDAFLKHLRRRLAEKYE